MSTSPVHFMAHFTIDNVDGYRTYEQASAD